MRAIVCRRWGDPDDLRLESVPEPALRPGGVRVAVRAAGVNYADLLTIAGRYQENPPLPFVPGFEVAGEIVEMAADVRGARIGDRVMGMLPHGGYAQTAVLPAAGALPIPPSLDFARAAGFPVAYGTAYGALVWRARLRPRERLLVLGAAGGVGLAAVEIGRALGATVIAVAAGDERLALARAHGADHLIDRLREDVAERVGEIASGAGADVVFDPVGGEAFEAGLRCIASEGRLVVVGFASGRVGQLSAGVALGKNIDLIGCYWGAYRNDDRVRKAYEELSRWLEAGRLAPHVGASFPLAEAARALRALRDREVGGKIVLTP
ncbi:zinc-binding dehydrogenase [Methylosinus sp. 3S-1]|nr:NADPH:quinone oxidoreductase family protein [Methylosinus trichosporium]OBS51074.1 zinc-binding dehydrogenase [Methylosinus sp. 3S-1]